MPAHTAPASAAQKSARGTWMPRGRPVISDPDGDGDDHADQILALAADVEEPAAKGKGHGERSQDQRRGQGEGLLEVDRRDRDGVRLRRIQTLRSADHANVDEPVDEPRQPRPVQDRAVGRERVLPRRHEDDEAGNAERDERRDDGRDGPSGPLVDGETAGQAGRHDLRR